LEYHKVLGRRFTWYHPNGRSMSRIDRMLISEEWNRYWGETTLWVLHRDVSDHCPLVLKVGGWDWGPRSFRFNNFWLENKNFKDIVEECWTTYQGGGWMGFILKEKLKLLKSRLKEWNKAEYGGMEVQITKLKEEIEELDIRGEGSLLDEDEVWSRKEKFSNLWRLLRAKDALVVQRSRVRWLKEGDANTKIFHNCMKARSCSNSVRALYVNGESVQTPTEVRRVVVEYFRSQVREVPNDRPYLDGVPFDRLTEDENRSLVETFTGEEIKGVVKDCDGNKSPGPDGFTFAFIKKFWYLLKDKVRIMFDQFHVNEVIPKSFRRSLKVEIWWMECWWLMRW